MTLLGETLRIMFLIVCFIMNAFKLIRTLTSACNISLLDKYCNITCLSNDIYQVMINDIL
jgi:hypothetical protein